MNWMDQFLKQCLEGVPEGSYRSRTEKELLDHLLSLTQDLEGAGYPLEEARSLAQARMGDPAELARRYMQEWNRRRQSQRWLCLSLMTCALLNITSAFLSFLAMLDCGFISLLFTVWPILMGFRILAALKREQWTKISSDCQTCSWLYGLMFLFWFPGPNLEWNRISASMWTGIGFLLMMTVWHMVNCAMVTRMKRKEECVEPISSSM